jgi:penicillin-binding protein 1C
MIANLGEYRPLRTRLGAPDSETRRCLSRGTCLSLFEMLDQTPPGELARELVRARGAAPRVCWKTGTSTGHQDAWAMVFNRNYVVGVWMGNNSGRASGRLVGGEVALPLAARIFRSLPVKNAPEWPESGGELREVRVCAVSGLPAVRWCGRTQTAWLPREMYLHRVCDMHYPGSDGGECVERWPGSAKGWDLARIDAPRILDPAREVQTQIEALRILAPAGRGEYVVTGQGTPDRLQLRASRDETETLHWYLDDRYVGKTAPETPLFIDLAPGKHNVGCMASDGTIDRVEFAVIKPDTAMAIY